MVNTLFFRVLLLANKSGSSDCPEERKISRSLVQVQIIWTHALGCDLLNTINRSSPLLCLDPTMALSCSLDGNQNP